MWDTENDIITVKQFTTPRLDGFNGNLFTTEVIENWLAVACSDCTSPFINFYDRDEFTLAQAYKMTGSYGQAKINVAWFKNEFNSLNVFVGASGSIDMIEIFTPPQSEVLSHVAED